MILNQFKKSKNIYLKTSKNTKNNYIFTLHNSKKSFKTFKNAKLFKKKEIINHSFIIR